MGKKKMKTYFFDTYAFFELLAGNKNYKGLCHDVDIVTTKLNLMELHYWMLISSGKSKADKIYDELVKFAEEIDDDTIKMANELRASLKKRNLSYIDCLGYTLAKSKSIKFLTGDKQFKDLENVEFAK